MFYKNKKKILIYCDQPDWAYDILRKIVTEDLKDKADFYFDYCYCHTYNIRNDSFFTKLKKDLHRSIKNFKSFYKSNYDFDYSYNMFFNYKVTPFWKKKIIYNGKVYERKVLKPWEKYDIIFYFDFYFDFYSKLRKDAKKIIKGIYTDTFPPQCLELDYKGLINKRNIDFNISKKDFFLRYFSNVNILACGSPKVKENFIDFDIDKLFLNYTYEELFIYKKRNFYKEKIIFGWTGNPNREFKNFYTIIVPAIKELKSENYNIDLLTRFEGPLNTLPFFYDNIDVAIITSTGDSGPSLFVDASLSGIPSISTKIGFPSIIIEDNINGFFIEPSIESLKNKIIELLNNRKLLEIASLRIREDYVNKLGKKILIENWKLAFEIN